MQVPFVHNRSLPATAALNLAVAVLLLAAALGLGACNADTQPVREAAASGRENSQQGPGRGLAPRDYPASGESTAPSEKGGLREDATSDLPSPSEPTQTSQGGSVTIRVLWQGEESPGASLSFGVAMDTHSVDLDNVDLSKLATLRNDTGREVKPISWEAPKGGHHRSGTLVFPLADGGTPVLTADTKYVELTIRDIAGVKERVLRWDLKQTS